MALFVTLTPRQQVVAAGLAVLITSGLALSHVAAQPSLPESTGSTAIAAPAPVAAPVEASVEPPLNPRDVNCIAKVVHHEAANQPRAGQIAVAQVLINRVRQGFGNTVCAVANQPGQFFRLNRYHPDRHSAEWREAVDVARQVLAGEVRDLSKGALYFHANWKRPNSFFRGRTKVARLEDHDFYR